MVAVVGCHAFCDVVVGYRRCWRREQISRLREGPILGRGGGLLGAPGSGPEGAHWPGAACAELSSTRGGARAPRPPQPPAPALPAPLRLGGRVTWLARRGLRARAG
ncbi:unnamed protein product [Rangifer tarandus platyrhynchus]|uniref:Uncharacterized protein n=2 Tax=Rangifer tarandus platyrhynchus TaxID=3082113 RepID=A0ACB0E9X5_RANTA|nr:unnamed protein product [Rangifer tarandus platyrhynchus]CAI9697243.1 unnamed protein product [Rangifer tarandus platyrhynchus]